jgi:uncharacterized protein YbjT (DUF2867 family)
MSDEVNRPEAPLEGSVYTKDLRSTPKPGYGKILVTGATGYIGGRLVPELVSRGYKVRVMVRSELSEYQKRWPRAEVVLADARNYDQLIKALAGVHTAYYLIHSLLLGRKEFESADIEAASNFQEAANENKVKRIIYLSGLGDVRGKLSPHLRNRLEVGKTLARGSTPVTVVRAGMIIGSGSASYEILRNLVDNTPLFFIPYWARTKSQPIAIRDVIKYLVGILEIEETAGKSFDIGGAEIITYDQKLKVLAKVLGKKRVFLPGLITYKPLYGYLASLLTPVPGPITKVLVEGCKNEVICINNDIKKYLDFKLLDFRTALVKALEQEEKDEITSRWSDAYPRDYNLAIKLHQLNPPPKYTSSYCLLTYKSASSLFESFCHIGGKMGWFNSNWMWRLRGLLDRIALGVGTSRGRRSSTDLRINDVIDFFRVENIVKNKLLLLRAEMKLPGKAWLEFSIDRYEGLNKLSVQAYFQPHGLPGVIYWYNFLPFHIFIFRDLIKQIEKRARS